MVIRHTVQESESGKTVFHILRYSMGFSAGYIRRAKFSTSFILNGSAVHTNYIVKSGDTLSVTLPEEHAAFPPESGPLSILFEDESVLAVNKPAGIIMHPSATRNTGTLANRILYYLKEGTVHAVNRLDRDTTGVTIFAKNSYIKNILTEDLQHGRIRKTYIAPLYGELPDETGRIELPISRIPGGSLFREINDFGDPSLTLYRRLAAAPPVSLYSFQPVTGRTHQIRLHCAASGAPILGDPYYTSPEASLLSEQYGLPFQQLCCSCMEFPHPLSKQILTISVDPPFISESWFRSLFPDCTVISRDSDPVQQQNSPLCHGREVGA